MTAKQTTRLFFLHYGLRRCLSAVKHRGSWDVSHLGPTEDIDFVREENGWFQVDRGTFDSCRVSWERGDCEPG